MTYPLIGLAGPARAGKDTVFSIIKNRLTNTPLAHVAFAGPIKAMIDVGLGELIPDRDHTKEQTIPGIGKSLRQLYQTLGTEWGRQFRRVLRTAATEAGETGTTWSPLWYHDASGDSLNPVAFSRDLGASFSSAISSASTAPGSDSDSGFDGGGSSGGGGGGGGGGGW